MTTPPSALRGKTPTKRQYAMLLPLASGAAGLSRTRRDTEPLLRRGWVTAEWRDGYYQWVRITPHGLHALAAAVERYGLPDIGPSPMTRVWECQKCGTSRHVRSVVREVEAA